MRKLINILKENYLMIFVVVIASFLRFYKITENPPSLNWDEVSHGYNAYSVLTTSRDEWGKWFPVIFRAYGDYKLPVYIYLTAISEFFFGLNTFAVRLPSIMAGVGTVFFTYFLALEMFKRIPYDPRDKRNLYAAIAALFVTIEPWSFFLSRAAFEANLALLFFVAGMYFFLRVQRVQSTVYCLLSAVFLGLTVWTYNSYRIFTPLMLLALALIYKQELLEIYKHQKGLLIYSLILLSLFLVPMFIQLLSPTGQARYTWVGILDQGSINKINEARGSGCSRLICNKYVYVAKEFGKNYISHFSPSFLFLKGGSQYQFNIPDRGILYLIELPLMVFGIFSIIFLRKNDRKLRILLLCWIVLSPIPSSLTRESPHVLRFVTLLPIPMLLSAMGLYFINLVKSQRVPNLRKISLFVGLYIYLILSSESYFYNYFNNYRHGFSQSWQYGYQDVSRYIKENYSKYDKIIITKKYGEPHEFLLFYLAWNPIDFRNDPNLNRFYQTNWYWVDGFDKFYFVNDWQVQDKMTDNQFITESKKIVDCGNSKCLLVTSPKNHTGNWSMIQKIYFLDGQSVFEIYEN